MTSLHEALDPGHKMAAGYLPGHVFYRAFGNNPDVDAATAAEDLWCNGGDYTGFPTGAAETLDIYSDSANDTAAGTGLRTVRVHGLDANYDSQTLDVSLNGVTHVTTTGYTWSRVHLVHGLTAGSGGVNAGTISIHHTTTTANVFTSLIPGYSTSFCAVFTVPTGKVALIPRVHVAISNNRASEQEATVGIMTREYGTGCWRLQFPMIVPTSSPAEDDTHGGILVPEKTDIKIRIVDATANNLQVIGRLDILELPA